MEAVQISGVCFMAYLLLGVIFFFWTRTDTPRFWFPVSLEYSRVGLALVIVGITFLWPLLAIHLMLKHFLVRKDRSA